MKKVLSVFFTLIFILSCNTKFKNNISDEFKIEFLNVVLNDSTFNFNKNEMVSNYPLLTPFLPKKLPYVSYSPIERITKWLLITDTTYIRNQIKSNRNLDFKKLEQYGWTVFDYKKLINDSVPSSKIRKTIKDLNIKRELNEFQGLINISQPIFNKKKDLAFIRFQGGCTGSPMYIYKKTNNKWKKHKLSDWIAKNDLMDPAMKKLFE